MKIANIEIIITTIIFLLIILLVSRNKKHKIDSTIANTEYIRNTKYYKNKIKIYYLIKSIFFISFIIALLSPILLIGKLSKYEYINKQVNNDIILCIDVSSSNDESNLSFIDNFKTSPDSRYGVVIFNTSSVNLSPLTYDYDYINNILNNIKKSIIANKENTDDNLYIKNYIISGTLDEYKERRTSLIGDGILSCINTFSSNNSNKSIILSTDYLSAGNEIISIDKSLEIGRNKGINIINSLDNQNQINKKYTRKKVYKESIKLPFISLLISTIIIILCRRLFIWHLTQYFQL